MAPRAAQNLAEDQLFVCREGGLSLRHIQVHDLVQAALLGCSRVQLDPSCHDDLRATES